MVYFFVLLDFLEALSLVLNLFLKSLKMSTFQNHQNNADKAKKSLALLRQEAKEEMGEVEGLVGSRIAEFKALLKKEIASFPDKDLVPHPASFDEFYLRCIRAKKYDLVRASNLYRRFCRLRTGGAEDWLNKMIPSWYLNVINSLMCSSLKTRDDLGRSVAIIRFNHWDLKTVPLDDMLLTIFLYMDELTVSEDTQLFGVTCIVDLSSVGVEHVKVISPRKIHTLIKVVQDAYPLRSKELHLVNNPRIFGAIYAVARPFIKEKMKKRIHFHGDDINSLHSSLRIDPALLPEFLGGNVSNDEYKDESVAKRILKKDPYYEDLLKYGYVPKPKSEL